MSVPQNIRHLTDTESASVSTIQELLRQQEDLFNKEIIGWGLEVDDTNPALGVNHFIWRLNTDLPDSEIKVDSFPNDDRADAAALAALAGRIGIAYGPAIIGGQKQIVLISRLGERLVFQGMMSTFGGPKDTGMRVDEGLAIVDSKNFAKYSRFFIDKDLSNPKPLGKNLDDTTSYLACRWDYKTIPRDKLFDCSISVRNPVTGKEEPAVAVDWGPASRTHRIADLSPGLADKLGLKTNDECIVTVNLPPGLEPRAPGQVPPAGVKLLSRADIEAAFGKIDPVQERGDGSFTILNPDFKNQRIAQADISPLRGISGVPANGSVDCHEKIRANLEAAVKQLVDQGKQSLILSWDGLWVPRHIMWDRSRDFSTHSWGIAFDINARWNGYGSAPPLSGERGSVRELVPIFEQHGFYWGGYFRTQDGMHFQAGQTG
jgi:hypothetical protein